MWMWLSCSSFFQQFFHCYCPVRFGRKTDPNGDFIRRYIPALKNMPTRYIHEPWVAPEAVQQAARCLVGRDYPLPMIDHSKASQINIERIKQVYAQLAKYKPQSTLNPHAVSRPNVMQSSPSPTSIITSINQSSYLCSQTPDPQTTTPQIISYKDADVFQRPMQNSIKIDSTKQPRFKQVVIVQKTQKTNVVPQNTERPTQCQTKENYGQSDVTYKTPRNDDPQAEKQENYDFKNLVINNYVSGYSTQETYPNQQAGRNEVFKQQTLKINSYGYDKPKFYLSPFTDNRAHVQTPREAQQSFVSDSINRDSPVTYNNENKTENVKDNTDDNTFLHPMAIRSGAFTTDRQNNPNSKRSMNTTNESQK